VQQVGDLPPLFVHCIVSLVEEVGSEGGPGWGM